MNLKHKLKIESNNLKLKRSIKEAIQDEPPKKSRKKTWK
jgi:hypothetical protein